jgi:hypothetical protein
MKSLILSLFLIFSSAVKCQVNSNIISKEEFNNITINNVKLKDIKATNADKNQLDILFTYDLQRSSSIDPEGEYYNYDFDGFSIGFSGIMGSLQNRIISSFEISNTSWELTIQGNTVTIGSHKDELGNVVLNTRVGGGKSVVYQYCDGCNNFLSLYLDSNNLITKIIYIEIT